MSSFPFALATFGAGSSFLGVHILGSILKGEKWHDVERVIMSCLCTTFNIFCFSMEFDSSAILSQLTPSALLSTQAAVMLGYYVAYGILEFLQPKRGLMVVHHAVASVTIWCAHVANVHQCICVFLMLFTISNPPLALAKAQYNAGGGSCGCASFLVFAFLFFTFRICLVPSLIWITLTDGWHVAASTGQMVTYYSTNTLLICLYIMQLVWFPSIASICAEKMKRM